MGAIGYTGAFMSKKHCSNKMEKLVGSFDWPPPGWGLRSFAELVWPCSYREAERARDFTDGWGDAEQNVALGDINAAR